MRVGLMECNRAVRVGVRPVRQDIRQRLMRGEVVVRLADASLRSLDEVGGLRSVTGARR